MRIGIDAKWYFSGPPSTRTLLQNLLPRLFRFYPEHEWVVFLDKKDRQNDFPFSGPQITIEYVWAGMNMLSNLFVLPRHMRKHEIGIMISQTFPSFSSYAKSIVYIHDVLFNDYPQFFTWKEKLYFLPLKWLIPKAHSVIVTTEFVANDLIRHKYKKDYKDIHIVPLGISADFKPLKYVDSHLLTQVKNKFKLPDSFILFVGRLNARKNIESLLKAIPFLHDTDIVVVIVGQKDGKTANFKHSNPDTQIRNRVLMTGSVTNEELPVIYAMAKLFCFPSFAEGFGLPPLEAMAAGIPAVVSGTTSFPEVCGDAALYIDPFKPESIAQALNSLMEDQALYSQKRKKGIEQASKFNWDETARLLMQSIMNTDSK